MSRWLWRTIGRVLAGGRVRRRPNPLLGIYRWRYELGLVGLVFGIVEIGRAAHWIVAVTISLAGIGAVLAWPAARTFVWSRYWSVVIQHRLRTAFHEAGLSTWAGRLPAILWASPRPAGVRVLVSLPGGSSARDLHALRPVLAAACFASDVYVERHPRFANLVILFVVTGISDHLYR